MELSTLEAGVRRWYNRAMNQNVDKKFEDLIFYDKPYPRYALISIFIVGYLIYEYAANLDIYAKILLVVLSMAVVGRVFFYQKIKSYTISRGRSSWLVSLFIMLIFVIELLLLNFGILSNKMILLYTLLVLGIWNKFTYRVRML